jgi:hypothetical protein
LRRGRPAQARLWEIPERLPPSRSDEKTIRGLGNSQTFATVASRLQAAPTRTIFRSSVVPERKVMFRQNPNIETRNSKQIRIPNDKITKRNLLKFHCFGHWNISVLVIVSDFEIRISASFMSDQK